MNVIHQRQLNRASLLLLSGLIAAGGYVLINRGHAAVSMGRLEVRQNVVIDASTNRRFLFNGTNIFMVKYFNDATHQTYADYNFAHRDEIFAKMKSLGITSIRLPMGGAAYQSKMFTMAQVSSIVASAKAQNIRVGLDVGHDLPSNAYIKDSSGNQVKNPNFVCNTDYMTKYAPALWTDVISTFKDEPDVYIEPWNEPQHEDCFGTRNGNDEWLKLMQNAVQGLRSHGYQGLIVLDGMSWADNWPGMSDPRSSGNFYVDKIMSVDANARGGTSNIILANHYYPQCSSCLGATGHFIGSGDHQSSDWDKNWGNRVGTYPIMNDETSIYSVAHPENTSGSTVWFQEFASHMVSKIPAGFNGSQPWLWNYVSLSTLTTNLKSTSDATRVGIELNTFGTLAKDALWSKIHEIITAPEVFITTPGLDGTSVSASSLTLTATARDDEGIAQVAFYDGIIDSSHLIGSSRVATATSNYSVDWDTSALPLGVHSVIAKAYDAVGNSTVSAPRLVQRVAPDGAKVGDINHDGRVDILDLSILLANWQQANPSADLNASGVVDVLDLSILLAHFGV